MATVTGMTAEAVQAITNGVIENATIDVNGHLILTKHDGSTVDAGSALATVPAASTTVAGIVELADNTETSGGTDATRAVTPAGLESVLSVIMTSLDNKQPGNTNLTEIANITPADNDIIQQIAGIWVNRTLTQLASSMSAPLNGKGFVGGAVYNGTDYSVNAVDPFIYVGPTDPGNVANGSVWFQTS